MPKLEDPDPQKVGFRLRGVAISTKAANLQKDLKKSLKGLQNELKMEPKASKGPLGSLLGAMRSEMKPTGRAKHPEDPNPDPAACKPGLEMKRKAQLATRVNQLICKSGL